MARDIMTARNLALGGLEKVHEVAARDGRVAV